MSKFSSHTGQLQSVSLFKVGRNVLLILGCLVLSVSIAAGMKAGWISGKAILAQHLLQSSWQRSITGNFPNKPWRWADIQTVARLHIPELQKSFIVLNDASGEAMAFGPGLVGGNPQAAETQTIAIGGHRDTHLAFLDNLAPGARFRLQNTDGKWHAYSLLDKQIIDSRTQKVQIGQDVAGLVLITCYPFNAQQTGGPLRLIARAVRL